MIFLSIALSLSPSSRTPLMKRIARRIQCKIWNDALNDTQHISYVLSVFNALPPSCFGVLSRSCGWNDDDFRVWIITFLILLFSLLLSSWNLIEFCVCVEWISWKYQSTHEIYSVIFVYLLNHLKSTSKRIKRKKWPNSEIFSSYFEHALVK